MNKTLRKLKHGVTVYYVSSLNNSSHTRVITLSGRPYLNCLLFGNSSLFIKANNGTYNMSLEDCNVIQNNYNSHRLFFSRRKAESYLKMCLIGTVKSMQNFK